MIQMPENKRNVPPVLTCLDGTDVSDSRIWYEKRRPEILELFRSQEYGRLPEMCIRDSLKDEACMTNVLPMLVDECTVNGGVYGFPIDAQVKATF